MSAEPLVAADWLPGTEPVAESGGRLARSADQESDRASYLSTKRVGSPAARAGVARGSTLQ
jgi:hypothetical protein